MSKLINFFFSFDKLMKESLVRALFWLGLLLIGLIYGAEMLEAVRLEWFAAFIDFLRFFAEVIFAVVAVRVVAELAIAIFRMNDNLSPDGGKSETADIDPVMEARLAAEQAAKRAQEATKSAVDRTSAATKSATDRSKSAANDLKSDLSAKVKPQVAPVKKAAAKPAKTKKAARKTAAKTAPKTANTKKPAPKKTTTSKTAAKPTKAKTAAKKSSAKLKRAPGMKLDGTPRKKPGPKKSS